MRCRTGDRFSRPPRDTGSCDADLLTLHPGLLSAVGVTALLPGPAPESNVITAR